MMMIISEFFIILFLKLFKDNKRRNASILVLSLPPFSFRGEFLQHVQKGKTAHDDIAPKI